MILLKKGDQLNHPFLRLLRQVDNPTIPSPHTTGFQNAVLTQKYFFSYFNFKDTWLK
jgi:hypothetical protein